MIAICETCGKEILVCDNQIALDIPAIPWAAFGATWTLMRFGSQIWATNGDPSPEGLGHKLHEHQPEGSALV